MQRLQILDTVYILLVFCSLLLYFFVLYFTQRLRILVSGIKEKIMFYGIIICLLFQLLSSRVCFQLVLQLSTVQSPVKLKVNRDMDYN